MRIVRWTSWLVLALALFGLAPRSSAQVSFGVAITWGPPELPVYEQPLCPAEGYIWTPGYWAWDDDYGDYFWVPGTWVEAPRVGYLWTPPYWGWGGDRFVFYDGYWGREVGFYGGINYGYGYSGRGYEGGRWDRDRFYYNSTVNNINTTNITNVYNTTVINNNTTNVTRVSYNGGNGGVSAQATAKEQAVAHEQHIPPPAPQQQHIQAAKTDPQLRASTNQGKPAVAATPKPAAFNAPGVVPAKVGGHYTPPPNRPGGNANANNANRPNNNANPNANNKAQPNNNPNRPPNNTNPGNNNVQPNNNPNRPPDANRPANPVHPRDLPPVSRPANPPNTGNPKQDQKYQQQQDKLIQKQEQERQRIQARQDQEHQRLQQQQADAARQQQVEQRHQQQTQQLQQKHEQQQQHLQQKYSPPPQRQQAPPPPPQHQQPPPQDKKPKY
jgi:hypothetical protein